MIKAEFLGVINAGGINGFIYIHMLLICHAYDTINYISTVFPISEERHNSMYMCTLTELHGVLYQHQSIWNTP